MIGKIVAAVTKSLNQQGFQDYRADSMSLRIGNVRAPTEVSSRRVRSGAENAGKLRRAFLSVVPRLERPSAE